MKIARIITIAVLIWVSIFVSFSIMSFIPVIKDSEVQQNLILYVLLIPIVIYGSKLYYKKASEPKGLILGIAMAGISLVLDAVITMPLVILPAGGSYQLFFINPLLWITTIEFVLIVFFYWRLNVKQ